MSPAETHALQDKKLFGGLMLCASCGEFTHFTALRVMSKADQTYRCNTCHSKACVIASALHG